MRRLTTTFALALAAAPAFGHGGMYFGPAPTLPPGFPGGGPNTAGPAGPTTGGPGGAGPATGAGSAFSAAKKRVVPSYTDWATWWRMNKHPYLNLRSRLGSLGGVTGVGRDGVDVDVENGASVRPSFSELEGQAIPVLRRLLREDDSDIVDSAVLALARITPADKGDLVLEDIIKTLAHDERSVRQSAVLALGVLGDPAATPILVEILRDSKAGQKALGLTRSVDEVLRAFAAVSLGYLSASDALASVRAMADKADDSDTDLKAGSLLALGLFESAQYDIVPFMLDGLDSRRMPELVQAQIPIALARLGDAARAVIPDLLKKATSRKTKNLVRQSCVIALGRLAAPEDVEIVEELIDIARTANDAASRNFAFIGLGEIGARAVAEGAERHEELLGVISKATLRNVVRPKKKSNLPWAATACALLARGLPADDPLRKTIEDRLFSAWKKTNNPDMRAALTIGLGLIEATSRGDALFKEMKSSKNREQNGYLAEALGLMRHDAARDEMKALLEDEKDPDYRVQLATGLGLMGDVDVSRILVEEMSEAKTLWTTSAIAKALGNVGDRSAVLPLLKLAQSRKRPGLARGFACVAIGLIGEKTPLPWNTRVTVGSNYLAAFYTQSEIMGIL